MRVAWWWALHVEVDAPPHILEDENSLRLAAPDASWRSGPDMEPDATRLFRASIATRTRFIDDLVGECAGRGVSRYVILGAGLDTFAHRRPDIASRLRIFEIDRDGLQSWKRRRLIALGFRIPEWLRFLPVDFEAGGPWWDTLSAAGFDVGQPALVASTGVSLYLTKDAIAATLREVAALAPGSTLAMTSSCGWNAPILRSVPAVRPPSEVPAPAVRRSSASSPDRRSRRWPAVPVSQRRGMCPPPNLQHAILPAGRTACSCQGRRRSGPPVALRVHL